MKSTIYRRLLILIAGTIIFAGFASVFGYTTFNRENAVALKQRELLSKAEAVGELLVEYAQGDIELSVLSLLCDKLAVEREESIIVFAKDAQVLCGIEYDAAMAESLRPLALEMIGGKSLSGTRMVLSGKYMLRLGAVATDASGDVHGAVFVMLPLSGVILNASGMESSLIMLALFIIPVLILVSSLGSRRIVKPLKNMAIIATNMAEGEFHIRASEDEPGEVGALAFALNHLCSELANKIYQLSEEKSHLNQILTSLSEGIVALDAKGELTHANPAVMRLFGSDSAASRKELIPDDSIWQDFDGVFRASEPMTRQYTTDKDVSLLIHISPVFTESGARAGVVGLFQDVTELERLERVRREYVANVSHELRTPLTALRGLLEPLQDSMVTDEQTRQRYYKIMHHEVLRLSRLITDMMELSKLQSGMEQIEKESVDLGEILLYTAERFKLHAQQKGVALSIAEPGAQGLGVYTNADRVEEALVILLDNAISNTPEGGSVSLSVEDRRDHVVVTVADTGCGIPQEDLGHVFERFYKVDKSRKEGGTGLGLSIAQTIFSRLGERIFVESEPQKGARFSFTLHKYAPPIRLPEAKSEAPSEPPPPTPQSKKQAVDATFEVLE